MAVDLDLDLIWALGLRSNSDRGSGGSGGGAGCVRRRRMAAGSPGLLVTRTHDDPAGRRVDCDFEYWRHDAILVRVAV